MLHIQRDAGQKHIKKMGSHVTDKNTFHNTQDNIPIIRNFLAFLFATHFKRTAQGVLLVPD